MSENDMTIEELQDIMPKGTTFIIVDDEGNPESVIKDGEMKCVYD